MRDKLDKLFQRENMFIDHATETIIITVGLAEFKRNGEAVVVYRESGSEKLNVIGMNEFEETYEVLQDKDLPF